MEVILQSDQREHRGWGGHEPALTALVAELTDRPLFAHVVDTNVASIRVLEKCGFHRIGEPTVEADRVVELLYRLDEAG